MQYATIRHPRPAMTLIELLVVVGIVVVLAAIAIPAVQPVMEGREVREAARAAHIFFNRARIRAMETRRPCGVMLERYIQRDNSGNELPSSQMNCCLVLRQVEVPPPYSGDAVNAKISVTDAGVWSVDPTTSAQWGVLVEEGDQLQINGQGPWHVITDPTPTAIVMNDPPTHLEPGAGYAPREYSYKVLRRPRPTMATPLGLPRGTIIDLGVPDDGSTSGVDETVPASGVGLDPTLAIEFNDTQPVMILFGPDGGIQWLYRGSGAAFDRERVLQPIHLLVGRWERAAGIISPDGAGNIVYNGPPLAEDGRANWEDLENLWVSISPKTGLISVAELAVAEDLDTSGTIEPGEVAVTARQYARQVQVARGGR